MIFAYMIQYLVLYTACIVIVYVTYYTGASLNVDPDKVDLLTDDDLQILAMGSKIEYFSFFIYTGCICASISTLHGYESVFTTC